MGIESCCLPVVQVGGLLVVAPEHRLSLHLKGLELLAKKDMATVRALEAIVQMPYLDVLDESDELLHHR